jgi:hypothetical protein
MKEQIKKILDGLYKTFCEKNEDYGNSFEEVRNEFKADFPVVLVRVKDKYNRAKTLLLKEKNALQNNIILDTRVDESIEDTLLDLANYCIMEVALRRQTSLPILGITANYITSEQAALIKLKHELKKNQE